MGLQGFRNWKNSGNGFKVIRIHYTADPNKGSEEWLKKTKKDFAQTPEGWEREFEINFEAKKGKRVYDCFKFDKNVQSVKFIPQWNLIRGWDFGYHDPACVFCQIDRVQLRLRILREVQGKDERIWDFRDRIKNITQEHYKDVLFEDFCDYHGKDERGTAAMTDIQYLNQAGIFPTGIPVPREQRISILNYLAFRICEDKEPGLLIDPSCSKIIDGLSGGLVYREVKEGEQAKDEIDRKSDFIHLNDALAYILAGKPELHPGYLSQREEPHIDIYPYLSGAPA